MSQWLNLGQNLKVNAKKYPRTVVPVISVPHT